MLVIKFSDIINNFNILIKKVNKKYSKNYKELIFDNNTSKEIFKIIKEMDKLDTGKSVIDDNTVAIPSDKRLDLKREIQNEIESNIKSKNEIDSCKEIYNKIVEII